MAGLDAEHNLNDDCDNIGLGCALEHFSEVQDVMNMIDNVKNIYETQELEVQYEKLYSILKQYYEQPHLLDPHLDNILAKFLDLIKDKESPIELKHAVFNYMYQIIRVRGHKVVVRHLPHEVSDLLMVLEFLEAQNPSDKETWRSRFVLLLWLSIVVIIPFHMSRLDGFAPGGQDSDVTKKLTVMERIFNICKTYSMCRDTCAEASAYLASKFLIRSDVKEKFMSVYFDWACEVSSFKEGSTIHYGVLAAVAAVLKHGKRDDLLTYIPKLLDWVTKQNFKQHSAVLVRKYGVKIVQRIGLTFLRPRLAAFRYTLGSRSLATTLGGAAAGGDISPPQAKPSEDDEQDIPQEVEEVVELLLCSLRDEDTIVRWSAAKGIGRIGARLPPAAAGDVVECVLTLFAENEREYAWHGGCMGLAELARRGLLSPEQLGAAVDAVVRALRRDEPRAAGGGGGRAARDAACHASWAFARAYDAHALAPHANTIANALIATACFDREINCRRAASAAYQENVGRHGMFPHGIDVLTTADFQSVGPRNNAYLVIAPEVAKYSEYTQPLIDHIVDLKIEHWDCAIRELAAKSLRKLTQKLPEYIATIVLPKLVRKTESIDLNVRHGAILGIGEAIYALSCAELADGKKADRLVSAEVLAAVRELVPRLRSRQQFRGLGGELMRQACCQCIASLALAKAPFHSHSTVDDWLELINECLEHEVQAIREKAIYALPLVFNEYLKNDSLKYGEVTAKQKRMDLMEKYCEQLSSSGVNGMVLRMGYARAVGSLPKFALLEYLPTIMQSLIECTKITDSTAKWAESRRDAVIGLTAVIGRLGAQHAGPALEALLCALHEYTVDMRGDVGAWVREAAMTGLLSICRQCATEAPHLNSPELIESVMCGVAQQAVEKIDRTRAHAGRVFTSFIYNDPPIHNIPYHKELKRIFPPDEVELKLQTVKDVDETEAPPSCSVVLWLFPGHTMPRFVQLLEYPTYRYNVLKGLIVSGGELTESLVKHTTQSLFGYLVSKQDDKEMLTSICNTIIKIFADNQQVKRITGPIFNFLDRLLSSGSISPILEDPESTFAMDILKHLQLELRGSKNIWYKLLDSINVLCQLVQVGGQVCSKALGQLVIYICYADCYVRRCTAARLYEALTLYGDVSCIPQDNVEKIMEILADTDWEINVTELKPIRNELCDLMGIKRPVPKQKTPS